MAGSGDVIMPARGMWTMFGHIPQDKSLLFAVVR
jgi:hypothetical protein